MDWDAWMQARLGNAIDVAVDRVQNRSPVLYDPAQAYGVDANGNVYALGQTNAQITAQVQTRAPANNMLLLVIIGLVVFAATEGG